MLRCMLIVAVLCAMPAMPAAAQADEAATIRTGIVAMLKAVVEEDNLAKAMTMVSDTVEYEMRENGWTSRTARGRRSVQEAVAAGKPSGKLATDAKMIHVALIGADATAVIDFRFTNDDGDPYRAVILMKLTKADGKWLATRIVICDNES